MRTNKLVVYSLDLALQSFCLAERLNKELGKTVQSAMQLLRASRRNGNLCTPASMQSKASNRILCALDCLTDRAVLPRRAHHLCESIGRASVPSEKGVVLVLVRLLFTAHEQHVLQVVAQSLHVYRIAEASNAHGQSGSSLLQDFR